jgi:hypothetical protein
VSPLLWPREAAVDLQHNHHLQHQQQQQQQQRQQHQPRGVSSGRHRLQRESQSFDDLNYGGSGGGGIYAGVRQVGKYWYSKFTFFRFFFANFC